MNRKYSIFVAILFSFFLLNINILYANDVFQVNSCTEIDQSGIYLLNQNIYIDDQCFEIEVDNVIFDCQGHTIRGDYEDYAFLVEDSRDVTIKNCNIENFEETIIFQDVSYSALYNITISDVDYGVYLEESENNYFENILVTDSYRGFEVEDDGDNNVFVNIQLHDNSIGFNIDWGYYTNNIIINSSFANNSYYNMRARRACGWDFINVVDQKGYEVVKYEAEDYVRIDNNINFSQLLFCEVDDIRISNIHFENLKTPISMNDVGSVYFNDVTFTNTTDQLIEVYSAENINFFNVTSTKGRIMLSALEVNISNSNFENGDFYADTYSNQISTYENLVLNNMRFNIMPYSSCNYELSNVMLNNKPILDIKDPGVYSGLNNNYSKIMICGVNSGTLKNSYFSDAQNFIETNRVNNFVFDNLTLENMTGNVFYFSDTSNKNSIINSHIISDEYNNIDLRFQDSNYNIIKNNIIDSTWDVDIRIYGSDFNEFSNNIFNIKFADLSLHNSNFNAFSNNTYISDYLDLEVEGSILNEFLFNDFIIDQRAELYLYESDDNIFAANSFENLREVDIEDSENYFNYTIDGHNIGNYWDDFDCDESEQRGDYFVCTSPNKTSVASGVYDYAPLVSELILQSNSSGGSSGGGSSSSSMGIRTCPGQILESGKYVLKNDLITNDTCFDIQVDDVQIDCNGYSIYGTRVTRERNIIDKNEIKEIAIESLVEEVDDSREEKIKEVRERSMYYVTYEGTAFHIEDVDEIEVNGCNIEDAFAFEITDSSDVILFENEIDSYKPGIEIENSEVEIEELYLENGDMFIFENSDVNIFDSYLGDRVEIHNSEVDLENSDIDDVRFSANEEAELFFEDIDFKNTIFYIDNICDANFVDTHYNNLDMLVSSDTVNLNGDNSYGKIILCDSDLSVLKNLEFNNTHNPIEIFDSNGLQIENITGHNYGGFLLSLNNVRGTFVDKLKFSSIKSRSMMGVLLQDSHNNYIRSSKLGPFGIALDDSTYNIMYNITFEGHVGTVLEDSSYNEITHSNFNTQYGLFIGGSFNNKIHYNFFNTSKSSFRLQDAYNNNFSNNKFTNNNYDIDEDSFNKFDQGGIGNYWDELLCEEVEKVDDKYICINPNNITLNENNIDYHPLIDLENKHIENSFIEYLEKAKYINVKMDVNQSIHNSLDYRNIGGDDEEYVRLIKSFFSFLENKTILINTNKNSWNLYYDTQYLEKSNQLANYYLNIENEKLFFEFTNSFVSTTPSWEQIIGMINCNSETNNYCFSLSNSTLYKLDNQKTRIATIYNNTPATIDINLNDEDIINVNKLSIDVSINFDSEIKKIKYKIGNRIIDITPQIGNPFFRIRLPSYGQNNITFIYLDKNEIYGVKGVNIFANLSLDSSLNDLDGDGINDTQDKIHGNLSNVNTDLDLDLEIGNNRNLSKVFDSIQNISFRKAGKKFIEFRKNLENSSLDLTNISIVEESDENVSKLFISGLNLDDNETKTIYFSLTNSTKFTSLCIKDSQMFDFAQISTTCDSASEYFVNTIPYVNGDIKVEYENATEKLLKISGLSHSGIQQMCTENWQYSDWSSCSNKVKTRTAIDLNNCGTNILRKSLTMSCGKSPSGGSPSTSRNSDNDDDDSEIVVQEEFIEKQQEENETTNFEQSKSTQQNNTKSLDTTILENVTQEPEQETKKNIDSLEQEIQKAKSLLTATGNIIAKTPTIIGAATGVLFILIIGFIFREKEE